MRDPWLPEHQPDDDELDDLLAQAREAWRGTVHLERQVWRGDDEAWRGGEHLADGSEHAARPEGSRLKEMTHRSSVRPLPSLPGADMVTSMHPHRPPVSLLGPPH